MIIGGHGIWIIVLLLLGTFLTVFYSCRIRFFILFNLIKSESMFLSVEGDKSMLKGMLTLSPFSIFGGMWISWNIMRSRPLIFIPNWIKILILATVMSAIFMYILKFSDKNTAPENSIFAWFMRNI